MILSGQTIRRLEIISPFHERTEFKHPKYDGKFTFGCGSASYDVTAEFDALGKKDRLILTPGEFMLASTIERFTMPDRVCGVVHDKSSWARRGLAVQNTFLDPSWCGYLTLELTNHSDTTIHLVRGMPIAQIVFHFIDQTPDNLYSINGKYQDQERGPQEAR